MDTAKIETDDELKQAIEKDMNNMNLVGDEKDIAKVLLGAATISLNADVIAKKLGMSRKTTRKWINKAKSVGLIKNGNIYHSGWDDEKEGGVAFLLDIAMILGLIERVNK